MLLQKYEYFLESINTFCFLPFNIVLRSVYRSIFWWFVYDISIHITVLFIQLWVLQVIVTYTNTISRMFPYSLV